MHGAKLGLIPYFLEFLFHDELNKEARHQLQLLLKQALPFFRQSATHGFPRLYFANGLTSLSNVSAEEHVGILFVTYVLAATTAGKAALSACDKMFADRIKQFSKGMEMLLIFNAWMSKGSGFWQADDAPTKANATRSIRNLLRFITGNFERKKQGWNISKMHDLLHVVRFIDMFGSPSNYDSGPSESLHKDVAKKPGRASQKRHQTFTQQAAARLCDRHVLDVAYNQLIQDGDHQHRERATETGQGSRFYIHVAVTVENPKKGGVNPALYDVRVQGLRALADQDLQAILYPDLVEFIVLRFAEYGGTKHSVQCCSEYIDDVGTLYRAHPNYLGDGCWHDWAWVSYGTEESEEGFTDVPAKIIAFLPDGVPGDNQCYAVCHPCQWTSTPVSILLRRWVQVPGHQDTNNGIPYDLVPAVSLDSHCLVVPDIDSQQAGAVFEVRDRNLWHNHF